MQDNPFTYGNPISEPSRFIGRTREVEQVYSRLRNREFESTSIVGDYRIGKTSLLKYLASPEARAEHGMASDRYYFVDVDLQLVPAAKRPEQLWRHILGRVRRHSVSRDITELATGLEGRGQLDAFDLDDFFQAVDDQGKSIILLVDEFEHITTNENFGPDFYYSLRSLVIQHRLALVTSSRRELVELCHDETIKSSPFFNIFANVNLRLFSESEYLLMVRRALSGTGVDFSSAELQRIAGLAGLHPFFLQAACHMLFESYKLGYDEAAREKALVKDFQGAAFRHFVSFWDNSSDDERITLTAMALLERSAPTAQGCPIGQLTTLFSRSDLFVDSLERRGLIISSGADYRLFSSLFGPWIVSQIAGEVGEQKSYREWLDQHERHLEQVTGRQGSQLKEVLPRIAARYRQLILTWASDPQTIAAVASILKTVLTPGS